MPGRQAALTAVLCLLKNFYARRLSQLKMPFVHVTFSGSADCRAELAKALSKAAASALGKPESYVMVNVLHSDSLLFGGSSEPAAMVQVSSIGGSCSKVCGPLTDVVATVAKVPKERVFVNFRDVPRSEWAMQGNTFG